MELKQIKKFIGVAVETTIEIVEKEKWHKFINNAFDVSMIFINIQDFKPEFSAIQKNPELLEDVKKHVDERFGKKYDGQLIDELFEVSFQILTYNIAGALSLAEIVKKHKNFRPNLRPKNGLG